MNIYLSPRRLDFEFSNSLLVAMDAPAGLDLGEFLESVEATLEILDISGRWYELALEDCGQPVTGMAVRGRDGKVDVYWDSW